MKAIQATNLSKRYRGDVLALAGLSLDAEAGTIFGLRGPNGAGKSTTVKILTTLTRAESGEARVAGLDVVRHADGVRRSIGVVGQKPGLDPEATGRENLEMQAEINGIHGAARRRRVDDLLAHFGLGDAGRRLTKTYSGGMQRRLDVALGLVHRPKSELHGDTVQVELVEASNGDAAAALQQLQGLSELSLEGRLLRARVENGAAAIPSLITTLEQTGARVASAAVGWLTLLLLASAAFATRAFTTYQKST